MCIDRFVPTIIEKVKRENPWISRTSIQMHRKLKRLKKKTQAVGRPRCLQEKIFVLTVPIKVK